MVTVQPRGKNGTNNIYKSFFGVGVEGAKIDRTDQDSDIKIQFILHSW